MWEIYFCSLSIWRIQTKYLIHLMWTINIMGQPILSNTWASLMAQWVFCLERWRCKRIIKREIPAYLGKIKDWVLISKFWFVIFISFFFSIFRTRNIRVYSDLSPLLGAKYENYQQSNLNSSIYKENGP